MTRALFLGVVLGMVATSSCSDPTGMIAPDAGTDSGRTDGSVDLGRIDMGGVDMGACLTGEHRCGTNCVADHSNDPSIGCALGCGVACDAVPEHATASCSDTGMCDFRCDAPFTRDFDRCVCTPVTCEDLHVTCGTPDNGCGTPLASCGTCGTNQMCVEGACTCNLDPHEPNDTASTPYTLRGFNDYDNDDVTFTDSSLHSAADGDWFAFAVTDGTDGGDPHITVTLDSIPTGSNYDMELFFACGPGGDSSTVEDCSAFSDGAGHSGCASRNSGTTREIATIIAHCSTTSEDGIALVHVLPASWMNTCNNYSLEVYVH